MARFTTMVQNTLRSRPGSIGCNLSKELPSGAVPIRNYLAILTQLGARTALHIALPPRPAGEPNLIDSESSDDGVLLLARKEQVGDALHTRHYIAPHRYHEDPSASTVPAGYPPVNIAGIPCCSNQQPPTGTSLLPIPPILRWQPSNSSDCGLGIPGGGRSSNKRASSHPRPGGGPTTVLQG